MAHTPHHGFERACLTAALVAASLVHGHWAAAQGRSEIPYEIIVRGRILEQIAGDPIRGAMILVRRDGRSQDLVVTQADGLYELVLERGSQYDIAYTAAGQVPKRVRIITKGAPHVLDVPTITMTVDIDLFPPLPNLSAALFDEVLGKAAYDEKARDIIWDEQYGKKMRNSIRLFMAKYDAQMEKQEAVAGR
ncbi:MAG: hypothetical protein ABI599_07745 [Flavobacteriales bacterium]